MKIKVGPIIIVACVAAVAGVALYVVKSTSSKQGGGFPGGPGMGMMQTSTVSVKTQTAEINTLTDYVNTNGEIETQSSIEVFPDIGGKVVESNVSLGSTVKKGDVIAEIDPSEPGAQYAHSPVYAPISGTITKSPLKPGATVNTASTITVIGDVSNLQVESNIPERYVASLKTGLKADIILEAYPDVVFKATVTRVSPVVDSTSRTKEIILNFDSKDSRINAGMFAKVTLYTDVYSGCITIPSSAVISKNDKNYVYVVNPDGTTVAEREVQLGHSVDDLVQIVSGVSVGEKVVVEGMSVLADGSMIKDITNGVPSAEENEENAGSDKPWSHE